MFGQVDHNISTNCDLKIKRGWIKKHCQSERGHDVRYDDLTCCVKLDIPAGCIPRHLKLRRCTKSATSSDRCVQITTGIRYSLDPPGPAVLSITVVTRRWWWWHVYLCAKGTGNMILSKRARDFHLHIAQAEPMFLLKWEVRAPKKGDS